MDVNVSAILSIVQVAIETEGQKEYVIQQKQLPSKGFSNVSLLGM